MLYMYVCTYVIYKHHVLCMYTYQYMHTQTNILVAGHQTFPNLMNLLMLRHKTYRLCTIACRDKMYNQSQALFIALT